MSASRSTVREGASLGPQVLGGAALVIGACLSWKGYREFTTAAERMSDDQSFLENPSLAPLVAVIGWTVFSLLYLVRQLVRPGADYPRSTALSEAGTDPDPAPDPSPAPGNAAEDEPPTAAPSEAGTEAPDTVEDFEPEPEPDSTDVNWLTPGLLLVALLGYALLLVPLGFVISTSLFFFAAVWILGSRHLVRDGAIGVALSFVVYYGFTELLSVSLPDLYLGGGLYL